MSTNPLIPVPAEPVGALEEAAPPRPRMAWEEIVAYSIVVGGIFFVLWQHLVPAVIFGLTLYMILDGVSDRLKGRMARGVVRPLRSEEPTSELQSLAYLVCRLLLE